MSISVCTKCRRTKELCYRKIQNPVMYSIEVRGKKQIKVCKNGSSNASCNAPPAGFPKPINHNTDNTGNNETVRLLNRE